MNATMLAGINALNKRVDDESSTRATDVTNIRVQLKDETDALMSTIEQCTETLDSRVSEETARLDGVIETK